MESPQEQAAQGPLAGDVATQMAELRQLILAQQQEMKALREQLAQGNQVPLFVGVPV